MKETNNITVTYEKPKKYYFVIEIGNNENDVLLLKVCDTYDEAVKYAHDYNQGNSEEYYYIVAEPKYYTGSKHARFYGMEFEEIKDNGDME
jgi:hypothetical protein